MDWLSNFLDGSAAVLQEIQAVFSFVLKVLVEVAQFIWNNVVAIAQFLVKMAQAVGKFFRYLWDNFFKLIFSKIFTAVQKAHEWLEDHLRPIIDFLKKVSAFWDKLYKTYVRPFLKAIQHVRQFLQLLRLLHINIATQLDKVLGQIQNDVQRAVLDIKGTLNATIDLLNIIADPTMLLRRPTMLLSLRRVFHGFIRQVTGLPPAFFLPSPSKSAPKGLGFLPANFDPANPLQNPPASYYLPFDDGTPSLDFIEPGVPVSDDVVDTGQPLGYFDNAAYSDIQPHGVVMTLEELIASAGRIAVNG